MKVGYAWFPSMTFESDVSEFGGPTFYARLVGQVMSYMGVYIGLAISRCIKFNVEHIIIRI